MNIFVVTGKESEDGGSVKQASKLGPRFRRTYTHRTEISVHGSRGGANVGEYGRTETSSDDKPVCFDCGLRGGSGEAASASGALAVRDGFELVFPGVQHPQSSSDDVHSTQHSSHAPQLPRRHHHVLQAEDVRVHRRFFCPGVHGVFPPSSAPPTLLLAGFRLLLGLLAAQPARLAAPVLSHRTPHTPPPPPPHAPAAHVAPRVPARQRPADARRFSPDRPEMRLPRRETLTETFGMAEAGKTRYSFFFQFSKDEQSLFLSEISFVFVFFSFIYRRFHF